MPTKQIIRYTIDLLMTVSVIALMAFSVTGQKAHEWLGIAAFILFSVHLFLNRGWFKTLLKGSYTPYRILQTTLVALLVVFMAAQAISGIVLSSHTFVFLSLPLSASSARLIHLCCAYWTFVVVSLHLGIHWGIFIGLGRKILRGRSYPPFLRILPRCIAVILGAFGAYCFVEQGIADYMFLRSEFAFFDFGKPVVIAIFEIMSMMSFWVSLGYLAQKGAVKLNTALAKRKRSKKT